MNQTLEIAHQAVKLYAESHPRPVHVTQRQAAEMLHLSPPTVSKLVKSGKLKLNGAGLIPISQIDELLLAPDTAHESPKIPHAPRQGL